MALHDRKHQRADALGRERIGGDAAGRRSTGPARSQGHAERRRQPGLDAHDLDAALVPGGDASDQAAAADRHQQCIDPRRLALQLEADTALAQHGFHLIEGVDRERSGLRNIRLAGGQSFGVDLATDGQLCAVAADARNLGWRGDLGDEDAGLVAQPHGRVRHRRAMIAARCGGDPGCRHFAPEQIGEGAANLEGAGMLSELELQRPRAAGETKVLRLHGQDRCFPDVRRMRQMRATRRSLRIRCRR